VQEEQEQPAQQMVQQDLTPQLLAQASPTPLLLVGGVEDDLVHMEVGLALRQEVLVGVADLETIHLQAQEVPVRLVKVMLEVMLQLAQLVTLPQAVVGEPVELEVPVVF
jgi:hypothetical protein